MVTHKLPTVFAGIIAIVAMRAQVKQTDSPSFEVASIRLHQGPVSMIGTTISGTRITMTAYTVSNLITAAYGLKDYQVAGATGSRDRLAKLLLPGTKPIRCCKACSRNVSN